MVEVAPITRRISLNITPGSIDGKWIFGSGLHIFHEVLGSITPLPCAFMSLTNQYSLLLQEYTVTNNKTNNTLCQTVVKAPLFRV
jgi:hypothetical protein